MDPSSTDRSPADSTAELFDALRNACPHERALLEDEIVRAFLPLASRLALRYRDRGVDLEDLRQVANLALVSAIRRFEADRGEFTAFATVTISGEIKKYFRDHAWSVRPPRSIQELQAEIRSTTADWLQTHATEPTIDELVGLLRDGHGRIAEARAANGCFRTNSLDAPVGGTGKTLVDTIEDESRDYELIEELADLGPACRMLSDGDKALIELRFFRELTQNEIGEILGISQMQVSRRLNRLAKRLRAAIDHQTAA